MKQIDSIMRAGSRGDLGFARVMAIAALMLGIGATEHRGDGGPG